MLVQKTGGSIVTITVVLARNPIRGVTVAVPMLTKGGLATITLTGLKFFFETTFERPEAMAKMSHVHEPRKLPLVLSLEEVTRLLQSAGSLKYQAALGVAYGAGLRASEVVHFSVTDIDSERRVIHVEQGKRPFTGPAAVLAYLSRYTRRGAIANSRLIALNEQGVSSRGKTIAPKDGVDTRPCGWPRMSSFAAACSISCPQASIASGTTG
jgi:hypothetical protein